MGTRYTFMCVLWLMLISAQQANSQYILRQADKSFRLYGYARAAALYAKAYGKKDNPKSAERAAYSYQQLGDYENAEKWYAVIANTSTDAVKLAYAKVLMGNAKYVEAKSQLTTLLQRGHQNILLNNLIASCDSAQLWMNSPAPVVIKNVESLNGIASDWGAAMLGNKLVFASDRNATLGSESTHKPFLRFDGRWERPKRSAYVWTGRNYYKLYQGEGNQEVTRFPLEATEGYHLGSPSFSADGKEMFFTMTRIPDLKKSDTLATINVEIYSAKPDSAGKWSAPQAFPFNKVGSYSVDDPFIKNDTLYFSSNMPAGKGGSDLYYSVRQNNGWGNPINLSSVNTEGNERSPALDEAGNFYFASDGLIGLGGLDIYRVTGFNTSNAKISNLKSPINTPRDDFAFSTLANHGIVYLSSDRVGGKGVDDIYSVDMSKLIQLWKDSERLWLSGTVYDKETGAVISGATVVVAGQHIEADVNGSYKIEIKPATSYSLHAGAKMYNTETATVVTNTASKYEQNFYLNKEQTLDSVILLPKIYYDFDKYNIRPDAAKILDGVVAILNRYPTLNVELGSHTDSRGPDIYNLWLSQKRAESAVAYLVKKGVVKDRIAAKGYGESRLVTKCKNGVVCTPPQHQLNRRTELKRLN